MSDAETAWAPSALSGPQDSPGFRLWSDFMGWQRGLNAKLRPFDLTQPQFAILAVCGWLTRDGQAATQRDLVGFLGMDRMHVSQIMTRLDRDGLIARATSKADLRSKSIRLTALGQARLVAAMPVVESYDRAFFDAERARKPAP